MNALERYHSANLPELMKIINRNGIGMDDYLDRFFNVDYSSNYPPYNLISVNNHESRLEVALAGFKKKDVNVYTCLLYTSPSPRDLSTARMPSSA